MIFILIFPCFLRMLSQAIRVGCFENYDAISYTNEIFIKTFSVNLKSVRLDYPNKVVLMDSGDVLRKTLEAGPFIRLQLLFSLLYNNLTSRRAL
jgi:hypothetical protein